MELIHLRGRNSDVIVDLAHGVPVVVYWGAPLGVNLSADALAAATERPIVHGSPDIVAPIAVVPEHGSGFPGRPGLLGHRRKGTAWAPRFAPSSHRLEGRRLTATARDDVAELELTVVIELDDLLTVTAQLTNTSATERYLLEALTVSLPLPQRAGELGTFTGRWTRELPGGSNRLESGVDHLREPARSNLARAHPRCCSPAPRPTASGMARCGVRTWRGAATTAASPSGCPTVAGICRLGELLHPGEVSLEPGESYRTPEVIAVHSDTGLTAATQQFHRHLRAAPHPSDVASSGARQHVGGRLLRSRPRHGCASSPTAPPKSASNGSCSTTVGSGADATTPAGSATGGSRPTPIRPDSAR